MSLQRNSKKSSPIAANINEPFINSIKFFFSFKNFFDSNVLIIVSLDSILISHLILFLSFESQSASQ